jgi:hypothetical protein
MFCPGKKVTNMTQLQENIHSTIKKKGQEIHMAFTEQFTLTTTKQGIAGKGEGGGWGGGGDTGLKRKRLHK